MPVSVSMSAELPPSVPGVVWSRTIPANLIHKEPIMAELEAEMVARRWVTEDELHWLLLCLDEALVNAILHGNEADETVPVDIALGTTGSRWVIRIDDRGRGFSLQEVPDQDEDDSLFLEHGRGIRLMREWLDEMSYWRNGATLWMARNIP